MENNEKITLQYLNSKAWYRLLKVVFVLCLLVLLVILNGIIIGDGLKSIDNNKTTISRTYGDKKTFTPQQIGIELSNYDFKNGFDYKNFFEGYNDDTIRAILKNCYPINNDIDICVTQKIWEVWGHDRLSMDDDKRSPLTDDEEKYLREVIQKIENSYSKSDKIKYLDYSVKLFDIQPYYSYSKFITIFIIVNLLILLFFEILRRTFYYVVLGSIKPKK